MARDDICINSSDDETIILYCNILDAVVLLLLKNFFCYI